MDNTVSMEADIPNYTEKANEVSALMAQVVKDSPGIAEFLKVQGAAIKRAMSPIGLSYFTMDAQGVHCVLSDNVASLDLDARLAQKEVFFRIIQEVARTHESISLAPNTLPQEALHGQSRLDEVPAPHKLPFFNETPYLQLFIPVPLGESISGVLHIWFDVQALGGKESLLVGLEQICAETRICLRTQHVDELVEEVGRLSSYTQFLEFINRVDDFQAIQGKIVEYARDASGADRVSLLVAKDYHRLPEGVSCEQPKSYVFKCSSGIQLPHSGSEESRVLERVGSFLLTKVLESKDLPSDDVSGSAMGQGAKSKEVLLASPLQPQALHLEWVKRESDHSDQDGVLGEYFAHTPMNYATVLPLRDISGQVCALLLIEGKEHSDQVAQSLLSMGSFIAASGRALGQFLFLENRWMLDWAFRWIRWKDRFLDTRKKRHWARLLVPALLIAFVLLLPVRFHVKAVAQVRPERVTQLTAQNLARIVSVPVHEGAFVESGALLVELDTYELALELQRYQGEYLRALTDADRLLEEGDEVGMQAARLQAEKAFVQMERIRFQLEQSSIRAPYDGIILGPRGLRQHVGQVAQVGELLVEIASPDTWEVRAHLTEQDLVLLESFLEARKEIPGELKLTSDPSVSYPLMLTSSNELSYGLNVQGDSYYFDAVLPLDAPPSMRKLLKAGFEGRVGFFIGWRPLAYVLFREVFLSIKVNWF